MSETQKNDPLPDKKIIITELCENLSNVLRLERQDNKELLKKMETSVFITQNSSSSPISFREHFEPNADILIYEPKLYTVGLVYVYIGPKDISLDLFIKECVDKACYLRNLSLQEANDTAERNSGTMRKMPIIVELVIICSNDDRVDVGNTLRDIAKKTNYLYYIGVNLLSFSNQGAEATTGTTEENKYFPNDTKIRRAFSWLLRKTDDWFSNTKNKNVNGHNNLESITLKNYRLPGERTIKLHEKSTIHIIHGYNGSGKSSIVEALEMVVTGKSERLGDPDFIDYDKVIRNSSSSDPAKIFLKFKNNSKPQNNKFEIDKTGINKILATTITNPEATSFRLDQAVMDRLTRGGADERAMIFIRAFFPNDKSNVEEYSVLRKKFDQSINDLPKKIKEILSTSLKEEDLINSLSLILKKENLQKSIDKVETCLPVPFSLMKELILFYRKLEEPLNILESTLILDEEILTRIDRAMDGIYLNFDSNNAIIRDSLSLLNQLTQWKVFHEEVLDFKSTFDEWLKMTALADLSEKYYSVANALQESKYRDYDKKEDGTDIFHAGFYECDLIKVKDLVDKWISRRDELKSKLKTSTEKSANIGTSNPQIKPVLFKSDEEKLDQLGVWLSIPDLGKSIRESIRNNIKIDVPDKSFIIGEGNWTQTLIEKTNELLKIWEKIESNRNEFKKGCLKRYQDLLELVSSYEKLKQMGEKVNSSFLKLLESDAQGNLIEVLNELLSVFTPARWAYEDISITHTYSGEKHELSFEIKEEQEKKEQEKEEKNKASRADLRLNTAELNLFAFSLFLLCAMRNPNPLSILIFDDPLQNMDEMTTTTLARGLARLSNLFPEDRQILIFFHGYEDLERFCSEVPSAVYFLPWLSPLEDRNNSNGADKTPEPIIIKHDEFKSFLNPEKQKLSDLLT